MRRAEPRLEIVERFFSGTGLTYDHIANLCTLGFDRWWKQKIIEKIPDNPVQIIDQACGTGILTFKIARRFPRGRISGVELREEYLGIARQKARSLKLGNVELILGRAEDIVLDGSFDCITSSYLAKYAELDRLVANARRMLRKGGHFIMHDFTYPANSRFAELWEFYFKLMQTFGSSRYPEWETVFYELPQLIKETRWVAELIHLLEEYDFRHIKTEFLTFGTSAIVSAIV